MLLFSAIILQLNNGSTASTIIAYGDKVNEDNNDNYNNNNKLNNRSLRNDIFDQVPSSSLQLSIPQSPPPLTRLSQAPRILVANNNTPPIANVGHEPAQKIVNAGAIVTLDGSASSDPDGDQLTYSWTQISGPNVVLSTPTNQPSNNPTTSFTAPNSAANLVFRLTVTDPGGLSDGDTVSIKLIPAPTPAPEPRPTLSHTPTTNVPPVANVGHEPAQKIVNAGAIVTLDGSQSYDPDGGPIVSYQWTQIRGPTIVLSGANTMVATLTAPSNLQEDATLFFKLRVTDKTGLSDTAAQKITIKHSAPINQIIMSRTFLVDPTILANTKQSIMAHGSTVLQSSLDRLLKEANKYMSQTASSVLEKTQLPPSGDKHDYLSLSKYWWPNPNKPNGLPYIHHDGKVNPEYYSIPDKANLEHMIDRVKVLSLSYYFTNNPQYSNKAAEFLRTWFLDSNTRMNPNLDFAQIIRGYNEVNPAGIMDAHNLPEVIDSIGLIQNSPSWTSQDQSIIIHWFEQYLEWLLNSDAGKDQAEHINNHGTWYDEQVASIALFLNKTDTAKNIIENYTQKRLEQQIAEDGSQPQEIKRTLGLSYSIFNLAGLFRLAHMAEYVGIDLWNYKTTKGVGLRDALDYLIPYLLDKKDWPYKQISPLNTDDFEDVADLLYQAAVQYHDDGNDRSYLQSYNSIIEEKNISSSIDNNLLYGPVNQ